MQVRTEERKTIYTAFLGCCAYGLIVLLQPLIYSVYEAPWFMTLYILVGSICVSVSFAIFAQGWLLFSHKLSMHRLSIAALFMCVAVIDLLQVLSYAHFPVFGLILNLNDSSGLMLLSRFTLGLGMIIIYCLRDQMVSRRIKRAVFSAALIFLALLLLLSALGQEVMPLLIKNNEITLYKKMLDTAVLLQLLGGIGLLLYKGRVEKAQSLLLIIRAMLLLAIGQGFFLMASYPNDLNQLLGLVSANYAYYLMLKGVYRLTIEDPFREQQRTEERMNYLAFHDDLTGLPNKRKLLQRLNQMIKEQGTSGDITAVAILNINRFKNINDSLGHRAADLILKIAGDRLKRNCYIHEEVFSMAGDEFAVIIPQLPSVDAGLERVKALLDLFEEAVVLHESEYHISLSGGVSTYPYDGDTADQLVQNADTALHHAKEHGVNIRHFIPIMHMNAKERLKLENDLRRGFDRGELYLEYQPLVHLNSGETVGMEALIRWNHPVKGLISPSTFIPLAEESGLIVRIGEWVLRTACEQNKKWQDAGYKPICVSVNLSLSQFLQPQLADQIAHIIQKIGLDPKYVELEITESMTMDKEAALQQLQRLKEIGLFISIDDFGTGYSSLHYLKDLPIDRLKIDRTFVNEVMVDHNDAAIVSTNATMAHHLNLKVTAEGVENEDQLRFLQEQNCHEGQGYFFSKPVLAEVFERSFLTCWP